MKILLYANTDWYLYNFRRSLAEFLRAEGQQVLLVSPPGPYGERLRTLGFRWEPAPMNRLSLNPWRELVLILWLRRLMVQERVDLIHSFTIKCAVYGSLAAKLAGVPARVNSVAGMGYVFTNNNLRARLLRAPVWLALRLTLSGRRSRLILQNPDDVTLFEQKKMVDPCLIRLIAGSGVDLSRFQPPLAMPSTGVNFRVLLPARLLWDKGLGELVGAARRLRAEGRSIEILIAGAPDPGNPASVPEETVRDWVAEGLIRWLGHVEDMPALYRSVDAVVLPSYREGLPKGLIEAGACGLPLVTTDVPGCRAVVTNGVNGLLVPAGDAEALAVALIRLADSPALCARLGAAARETALARFDARVINEQTLMVYRELLDPGAC